MYNLQMVWAVCLDYCIAIEKVLIVDIRYEIWSCFFPIQHLVGIGQMSADFGKMQVQGTAERMEGSIKPANPFSAEQDAEVLRKAMKGFGKEKQFLFVTYQIVLIM